MAKNVDIEVESQEDDWISHLTMMTILEKTTFDRLLKIEDKTEQMTALAKVKQRARELHCVREFQKLLKHHQAERAAEEMEGSVDLETVNGAGGTALDYGEWCVNEHGVYCTEISRDGEVKTVTASPVPVVITKLICDAEEQSEGVELAFQIRGGWHTVTCSRSEIADKSKIIRLADAGLLVTSESAKYLVRYLNDLLARNMDVLPCERVIHRFGWYEGQFIPYSESVTLAKNPRLTGMVAQSGDFEVWRAHIGSLIQDNVPLRLFLAASFASVLIEPLEVQNFLVHLWGRTGVGKSVALIVAASVWGNPNGGLFGTMNGTLNFLQSQAALLRNLPLCLDELQTIRDNAENYDKFIMQLGVGVGRGRADREGKAKKTVEWKNAVLCTGEEPLLKPNSGGGAVNRVLQICVDNADGMGEIFLPNAAETVRVVNAHYGTAGKRFIASLLNEDGECNQETVAALKSRYNALLADLQERFRENPTSGKQAAILALLLTTDEWVNRTVYQIDKPLTAEDVLPFAATAEDISKSSRAREYILNQIAIHQNDFYGEYKNLNTGEVVEEWGHQPTGRIYGKLTEGYAYCNKQVLTEWLDDGGYSFDAVKKDWADSGFLIRNAAGRFNCNCPKGMTGTFVKLHLQE